MTSFRAENPADFVDVTLAVRDWQIIDATIDNTIAMAAVNGDERTIERGRPIRDAGWAAARGVATGAKEGWGGWPPAEDDLNVALPVHAWQFVIDELLRWQQIEVLTNPQGEGSPEPRSLAIANLLTERIGGLSRTGKQPPVP